MRMAENELTEAERLAIEMAVQAAGEARQENRQLPAGPNPPPEYGVRGANGQLLPPAGLPNRRGGGNAPPSR
jgi:hypothetical protein